MPTRDTIVIGASAGGLDVLKNLVGQFPAGFPAAVLIALHLAPDYPSMLAPILGRAGRLPADWGKDGEGIQAGRIYVAPPDRHLLVDGDRLSVSRGPRENRFRPSIDVLFRSAAWSRGPRVTGVILSGALDDGVAGLLAIKQRGGQAVVQDPQDALYVQMPRNALREVRVDHVVRVVELGKLLAAIASEEAPPETGAVPERMQQEVKIARGDLTSLNEVTSLGEPINFTCPECHGTLMRILDDKRLRFRCHTGHAFSVSTLLSEVTLSVEQALWNGVRTVEESEMLMRHIAGHLQANGQEETARLFLHSARDARKKADAVKELVMRTEILSEDSRSGPEGDDRSGPDGDDSA